MTFQSLRRTPDISDCIRFLTPATGGGSISGLNHKHDICYRLCALYRTKPFLYIHHYTRHYSPPLSTAHIHHEDPSIEDYLRSAHDIIIIIITPWKVEFKRQDERLRR